MNAILEHIQDGSLSAQPVFVLSNNSSAGALEHARRHVVPTYHVSTVTEGGEEGVERRMLELLRAHPADLLVLAGYMRKVPPAVLGAFPLGAVNIHPALLPAFGGHGCYGMRVHEAVIQKGCQYSGITVHRVDPNYDEGQILLQRALEIPPWQTPEELASAVLKLEHAWYWQVLQGFAEGDIRPVTGSEFGYVDITRFRGKLLRMEST